MHLHTHMLKYICNLNILCVNYSRMCAPVAVENIFYLIGIFKMEAVRDETYQHFANICFYNIFNFQKECFFD